MQVQPIGFTGSGEIGTAAYEGQASTQYTDAPWGPEVNVPAMPQTLFGLAVSGFTKTVVYNGSDATGVVVAVITGDGTLSFANGVQCYNGLYVGVTGTGAGSVFVG